MTLESKLSMIYGSLDALMKKCGGLFNYSFNSTQFDGALQKGLTITS